VSKVCAGSGSHAILALDLSGRLKVFAAVKQDDPRSNRVGSHHLLVVVGVSLFRTCMVSAEYYGRTAYISDRYHCFPLVV
jgi:hypothetical protein